MKRWIPLMCVLALAFSSTGVKAEEVDKAEYYDLEIALREPSLATIFITKPASFPDSSVTYQLNLNCRRAENLDAFVRQFADEMLIEARAFAASEPALDIGQRNVRVKDIEMTCQDNKVLYKGKSLNQLFEFMPYSGETTIGAYDGKLEFVIALGYQYPTIEEGFFAVLIPVEIGLDSVSASPPTTDQGETGETIVLIQRENASPIIFDNQASIASFDPTQPATLAVDRGFLSAEPGTWDILHFNYEQGTLLWERSEDRPY